MKITSRRPRPIHVVLTLAACVGPILCAVTSSAAPPPPQALPADTLAMITVPDWRKACAAHEEGTLLQLWNDPALKPFREHFAKQWKKEVVEPLQRELDLEFSEFKGLAHGQMTLALIRNTSAEGGGVRLGRAFLMDSGDQKDRLKSRLEELRKKWVDGGKRLRTETVRGVEFAVVKLDSDQLPDTLRKFLPGSSDVEKARDPEAQEDEAAPGELFIGMEDSMLLLTDGADTAGKVLTRLTGGALPPLAEMDQFAGDATRFFRTALFYGWVNAAEATQLMAQAFRKEADEDAQFSPDPFAQIKPERVIAATGLGALRSAVVTYDPGATGDTLTLHLGVPANSRTGIMRVLAGEAKEAAPPPFVPADVLQFQRWRLDGRKTYTTLEQMLREISPQMVNGLAFALSTADLAAKEKNPNFSLRGHLVDNLGDDLITYTRPPRSLSPADLASPPSLFLIASRDGHQMITALKMVLSLLFRGEDPQEREFLGTTITTFKLPNPAMFADPTANPREFNLAVSRGYLALSADTAMLEEFLRSADNPVRPLNQVPGFAEAVEAVAAAGNSLLSYENQRESMRMRFEILRQSATNETSRPQSGMTPIPESLGLGLPRQDLKEWFDFSLLPPFEQIEKYFHHTVTGGGGSAEGLTLRVFSPTPPALRQAVEN